MPERQARMFSHAAAEPTPTGEMMPIPVTTTRRLAMAAYGTCGFAKQDAQRSRAAASRSNEAGQCRPAPLGLLLLVRIDVIDGLLHRRDLLGLFVGDLGFELFLERHDQLDRIQRVSTKVVDE